MRGRMRAALLAVAAAAGSGGCALESAPQHDEVLKQALPASTIVPSAWTGEASDDPVANDWLTSLGDPQLEAILAEALANNPDLRVAAERVTVAWQSAVVVGSQLLPQVNGQVGGLSSHFEHESGYADTATAFLAVGWELDVWGRLRAQRAAAEASAAATALDYRRARQSLAATVAKAWYLAIETRQLLELAEQSVQIYSELLQLVTLRRTAGRDSDLDVFDTRAKMETAQSEVHAAQAQFDESRRALETLLGRYPAAEIAVAADYRPLAAPPAAGLPAGLLLRRPDVAAAEQQVLAAFRLEESARLSLLPQVSLALLGGYLGTLLDAEDGHNPSVMVGSIGASIPIYDGGALQAQVEIATAQQAQAVASYGGIVLAAFREVEDSLQNETLLASRLPLDESALQDRTASVRVATQQYQAGRQDLLWVSNLQTSQLEQEASLIKLRSLLRVNRVRLLLALGGDFDAAPAAAGSSGE